jgi:hypothetical protein
MSSSLRIIAGRVVDSAIDMLVRSRPASRRLLQAKPEPTAENLQLSFDRGCRFLRRAHRSDGAFVDFLLYPGASDVWISAHVAFVLEHVHALSDVLLRTADFLEQVGQRDGLWGYNRRVAPDLDSTAQALMVLQRHCRRIERSWTDFVLAHQAPSGGFPTYAPSGPDGAPAHGWQAAHPDVTLIAAELLRRLGRDSERERAFTYLRTVGGSRGVVPPYWWNTHAYTAWASVRAGFAVATASTEARCMLSQGTASMPALAMLLSASAADQPAPHDLRRGLASVLAQQAEDGSWPCDPCLRVTDPNVFAASAAAQGRQYAGMRRVLSTAHAVAAIVDAAAALQIVVAPPGPADWVR